MHPCCPHFRGIFKGVLKGISWGCGGAVGRWTTQAPKLLNPFHIDRRLVNHLTFQQTHHKWQKNIFFPKGILVPGRWEAQRKDAAVGCIFQRPIRAIRLLG